jgi:predicted P-loop ATPase
MPLEMLIKDTTGMRRFWEIVVDSASETSKRWADLNNINIKLIWQSADHNDEVSPIEPYLQELQVKQENIREKSIIEWLLDENIIEITNNLDEYSSAMALTNAVNVSLNQTWSSRALCKEWKKAGLHKKTTNSGVRYGVKIVDLDVLHTLKTKYNMRIGGTDKEGYQF